MNNYIIILLSLFLISSCGEEDNYGTPIDIALCDDSQISTAENRKNESTLSAADWPTNIRSFIATDLPGYLIESIITYDIASSEKQYLVSLNNQGSVLFDQSVTFVCAQGEFVSYEDDDYIKISDLPQSILDYVAENYSNVTIEKAEFEDGEYEIELSNDIELCF